MALPWAFAPLEQQGEPTQYLNLCRRLLLPEDGANQKKITLLKWPSSLEQQPGHPLPPYHQHWDVLQHQLWEGGLFYHWMKVQSTTQKYMIKLVFLCSPGFWVSPEPRNEWVTAGNLSIQRNCHAVLTIRPQQLPCLSGPWMNILFLQTRSFNEQISRGSITARTSCFPAKFYGKLKNKIFVKSHHPNQNIWKRGWGSLP